MLLSFSLSRNAGHERKVHKERCVSKESPMTEPHLEDMLHQKPPRDELGIQDVLDRTAKAITSGDGATVAALWEVPAYVLGDDISMAVSSLEEAAKFLGGNKAQYNAIGVVDTRADIEHLEEIGKRLVSVRVRWPWLDAAGKEVGGETSTYVLRRNDAGEWKFRVAVMHGAETH
jgi:hypothetical protein